MLNNKKSLKFRSESFQKFHYITTVYISMILTNRGSQTVHLKYCKIILLSMKIYPSLVGSKFFPLKKCMIYLSLISKLHGALRLAAKSRQAFAHRFILYLSQQSAIVYGPWTIGKCAWQFFFRMDVHYKFSNQPLFSPIVEFELLTTFWTVSMIIQLG